MREKYVEPSQFQIQIEVSLKMPFTHYKVSFFHYTMPLFSKRPPHSKIYRTTYEEKYGPQRADGYT